MLRRTTTLHSQEDATSLNGRLSAKALSQDTNPEEVSFGRFRTSSRLGLDSQDKNSLQVDSQILSADRFPASHQFLGAEER